MAERLVDPKLPTAEEREEHVKHHLPFRSWCAQCVQGNGKEAPHRRQYDLPSVPGFHSDFMVMGDEGGGEKLAMWVVKEKVLNMLMATVVPHSSFGDCVAKRRLAFIWELVARRSVRTSRATKSQQLRIWWGRSGGFARQCLRSRLASIIAPHTPARATALGARGPAGAGQRACLAQRYRGGAPGGYLVLRSADRNARHTDTQYISDMSCITPTGGQAHETNDALHDGMGAATMF